MNNSQDVWYSKKQQQHNIQTNWKERKANYKLFAKLETGEIVEYTALGEIGWDDAVFLGKGDYDHSEPMTDAHMREVLSTGAVFKILPDPPDYEALANRFRILH